MGEAAEGADLLSPTEAAKRLGMTVGALRQAVQRGSIVPAQRTIGGHARYSVAQIEALRRRVRQDKSPGSKFAMVPVEAMRSNAPPTEQSDSEFIALLLLKQRILATK